MAIRFFDVNSDSVMGWGFRQKPLGGYFHFVGTNLHLNLNGGYPIMGFSEERLTKKVLQIAQDFRDQKGFLDQVIGTTFKARVNGEFYFFHITIHPDGQFETERLTVEEVVDKVLPDKVSGGLRHGDFFVKPDGQQLWLFSLTYHILMSLDAATGKIRVYSRDPLMDSILDFDPSFLVNKAQELIMRPTGINEQGLMSFDEKQTAQMFKKVTDSLKEWLTPEHIDSLKLEITSIEVSGQDPVTMKVARLFSFQCVVNFEATEHLTIYTDKHHFWIYSELDNREKGECLKTLESIPFDNIIETVVEKLKRQVEFEVNGKVQSPAPENKVLN